MAWPRWLGRAAAKPLRWIVLDVESSGLDAQRDRLLAIAALAVQADAEHVRLLPGDSFEVVLRQDEGPGVSRGPDKANILLHGIGVAAQRSGRDPAEALQAFVQFVGPSPLLAFHAGFDRVLIERNLRDICGQRLANPWLDLADLAPTLCPQVQAHALDEWLAHFGIVVAQRHQAAADTWATAELLQRLWPLAKAQGCRCDFDSLAKLAASRRWLSS